MNYKRLYQYPKDSSWFLFGPRGVGKRTFVTNQSNLDLILSLLDSKLFLALKRDPSHLEQLVGPLKKGETVFIDEIQKLPELLDEVHKLIEGRKLNFILSGSSARKLKRSGVNLLAGRALTRKMFPFSLTELGQTVPLSKLIEIGTLPVVISRLPQAKEVLHSYIDTYLKEEIREEALSRSFEDFSRFLEIAGQLNGRVLNLESIGSETGKSGDTIKKWYTILEETLLGSFVPSFRPGFKVREVTHSKFYFFDPGVARASSGLLDEPLDSLSKGFALETLVLNELRIYHEQKRKEHKVSFYAAQNAGEIDFIVETQKKTIDRPGKFISIEIKAAKKWKSEYEKNSRTLFENSKGNHEAMIGVYLGDQKLKYKNFEVYPLFEFIEALQQGKWY